MNRRKFIKAGALFVPSVFIPRLACAQFGKSIAFRASAKKAAAGGGGCTPSYAPPLGTGDRHSTIALTSSRTFFNEPDGLLDGNNSSSNSYWTQEPAADEWFQFDFVTPSIFNGIKWYQSKTTSHGTFKIQGFNGSSATDVGGTFTLGGSGTQTITTPSANTTAYRYCRFTGVVPAVDFTTFLYEVEFSICTP